MKNKWKRRPDVMLSLTSRLHEMTGPQTVQKQGEHCSMPHLVRMLRSDPERLSLSEMWLPEIRSLTTTNTITHLKLQREAEHGESLKMLSDQNQSVKWRMRSTTIRKVFRKSYHEARRSVEKNLANRFSKILRLYPVHLQALFSTRIFARIRLFWSPPKFISGLLLRLGWAVLMSVHW